MQSGDLVAYPMMIWLEMSGRAAYLKGGTKALREAALAHLDRVHDSFRKGLDEINQELSS